VIATSDFVALFARYRQNRAGMRGFGFVRRLLRLAVMGALVTANDGCLVLSDPDFRGQDECVPFFLTLGADPSVKDRPRIEGTEFSGNVQMRTCALTKDYVARVFVDGALKLDQPIPPSGQETRDVPVLVDIRGLAAGCHFVELYVSSAFRPSGSDFTQPARAGDIAFLLWTFVNTTDATVASCGGS
jgi:hypothetical protein